MRGELQFEDELVGCDGGYGQEEHRHQEEGQSSLLLC